MIESVNEIEFITAKQLALKAKVSEPTARRFIRLVNEDIKKAGGSVLATGRAPLSLVLQKMGLKGE